MKTQPPTVRWTALLACAALIGSTSQALGQSNTELWNPERPKELASDPIGFERHSSYVQLISYLPPTLIIEGVREFTGQRFGARTIVFKKGARMVIAPRNPGEAVLLMANEIVLEGEEAVISWKGAGTTAESNVPARGKPSDGAIGRGEGAAGEPGANGETGNAGQRGLSAPLMEIFVRFVSADSESARLKVDLRGQAGGQGGQGGEGGRGGTGAKGAPSVGGLECKRAAGKGGDGGIGGNGGAGGQGGAGGNGGSVNLISTKLAATSRGARAPQVAIEVYASPGAGGAGGLRGMAGNGGAGGPEGDVFEPCKSNNLKGDPGVPGAPGAAGTAGTAGTFGTYSYVLYPEDYMEAIFQPIETRAVQQQLRAP